MKVEWIKAEIAPVPDRLYWVHVQGINEASGISLGVWVNEGYGGSWCDIAGDEWDQVIDYYAALEIPNGPECE